ncbi:MAG: cysteine peptidase family C39 domain-containing protein [Isosphaeraceae bacterium]
MGFRFTAISLCVLASFGLLWPTRMALAADGPIGPPKDSYRCCGLNCLAVLAHFHSVDVPLESIEKLINPRANGDCSVADIERAAQALGLDPLSAQIDWNMLPRVPSPCIVQLRSATRYATGSHFAVFMGLHRSGVILLDAPNPAMLHPYEEFRKDFTGVVITFPRAEVERRNLVARLGQAASWAEWSIRGSIVVTLGAVAWLVRYRRFSRVMGPRVPAPVGDA